MKYILKRLGFYILAFFGAVSLNFFLPRMMPGNPVQMYIATLYQSGGKINAETIAAIEKLFGYNQQQPLIVSFFNYIISILKGDWGISFTYYPQTVLDSVKRGLTWTVFLMGTSLIIGFIINTLLGILAAWKRGGKLDTTLTVGGQILANVPSVVVAIILSFALGFTGVFPRGYAVTPLFQPANTFEYIKDVAYHAFLPVLSILITGLGGIMGMRANMINQLGEDYIVMGIAKGVPDRKIMFGYGARNALLPVVTSLAMSIGFLLGGSLIVEQVFNYPGLGKVMVNAINRRDYPLMQGILLMSTVLMLSANFIADISITFLDPRIRRQGASKN
ncbi:ABC transporter permease [Clostridium thermarum]|uniref:ABC transporter permease n=1 Tax=Clostridium thermarum TaxID=1716543 RepID=UPI001121D873|nr:ABC transporter permease [Clostridium thermarum]